MSFLSTLWLTALAALALPTVLHLLSRGHRRRRRVGSVRLLARRGSASARRLKPSQILLLLARCLLLTALALALAEPRWWRRPATEAAEKGWILVSPAVEGAARPHVEALRSAGHVLHPLVSPRAVGHLRADASFPDLWSLLREADLLAPPGIPFFVFTADRLTALRGQRPTLRRHVEWTVIPTPAPDQGNPARDTRAVIVALHAAADRDEDAAYVRAALEAAAEQADLVLRIVPPPDAGSAAADPASWLIHLSPEPLPEDALELYRLVLSDGPARHVSLAGRSVVGQGGTAPSRAIEIRRLSPAADPSSRTETVLWWATGRATEAVERLPLLSISRRRESIRYRFHGRFHPSWSNLVLDPAFPEWLLELLLEAAPPSTTSSDPRSVDAAVVRARAAPDGPALYPRRASGGVEMLLWISAAFFFVLERILATRIFR